MNVVVRLFIATIILIEFDKDNNNMLILNLNKLLITK